MTAFKVLLFMHSISSIGRATVHEESEASMAALLMDGFDMDRDDHISMQELLAHSADVEAGTAFTGWQTGFQEADSDQDGLLSTEELASFLTHLPEQGKGGLVDESEHAIAQSLMDGFDTDKDGTISLDELLVHVQRNQELHDAFSGWQAGFLEADADSNGRLSVTELASLLKHVGVQDQHKLVQESEGVLADTVMDGFDIDRDGSISLQELLERAGGDKDLNAAFKGWRAGFLQADVDKDGLLSKKELASLLGSVSRKDKHKLVGQSEKSIASSIMDGFDTDKDRKLSMQELMTQVGNTEEANTAFKGWQAGFEKADLDKDYHLTEAELASLLGQISRQDQQMLADHSDVGVAESMMLGFDADKNQMISMKELLDHIGDAKDKEAFKGWQAGFLQADSDHDGQLTIKELAALLGDIARADQRKLVEQSEMSVAESIMNGFDTNKDGKLALTELVDHVSNTHPAVPDAFQGWEAGFLQADSDQDGHLSIKELGALLATLDKQSKKAMVDDSSAQVAESIILGFDADKDGMITMAELAEHVGEEGEVHEAFKGWKEGFLQADVDKDGHLNSRELASLLGHVSRLGQKQLVEKSEDVLAASIMEGFDTDRDGKIGLDELKIHIYHAQEVHHGDIDGWESGFNEADKDQDQHLDAEELSSFLATVSTKAQQALVHDSEVSIASHIMEGFDSNKDEKLSSDELMAHIGEDGLEQSAFKGWDQGFKMADTDEDGFLSKEELEGLLHHVSSAEQSRLAEKSDMSLAGSIMDGFDTDRDGMISLSELLEKIDADELHGAYKNWPDGFLEADFNKDGKLSIEELGGLLAHVSKVTRDTMISHSETEVAASIIAGFDEDKNGMISLQELLDHIGDETKLDGAFDGWEVGFHHADSDQDDQLDQHELSVFLSQVSRSQAQSMVETSEQNVAASIMNGFDSDNDGKISLMELLEHVGDDVHAHAAFEGWQIGFNHADHDGDMYLDYRELSNLLSQVSRQDQSAMVKSSEASMSGQLIKGFDEDHDGMISLNELHSHFGDDIQALAPRDGWEQGFAMADADDDGNLNEKELAELLTVVSRKAQHELLSKSVEVADSLVHSYDVDGDAKISLQELKAHVGDKANGHPSFKGFKEGFYVADADGDNKLDAKELRALLKAVYNQPKHDDL